MMMDKYLLGIDIGTNETKGCLIKATGEFVCSARREHSLIMPAPGFAEHDPTGQWWADFVGIIEEVKYKAAVKAEQIAAIGVSTIMAAVTFLDEDLNPLRNAILYGIDSRSSRQAEDLTERIGRDRLGKVCKIDSLSTESFGPKILWVRENEPGVYEKTKHITFASGFINARLTGNFAVDKYSVTSATPMINNNTYTWDDELTSFVCDKNMLPDVADTAQVIGYVTKKAEKETGLSEGTAVICGTTDAGAEALSAGVTGSGDTMLMYGSTAFLLHVKAPSIGYDEKLWPTPYVIPKYECVCAGTSTAGSITKWIKNNFAKDLVEKEKSGILNAFDALFREAEKIPLGSDGLMLLPYFMGQRMPDPNPEATGLMIGLNLMHTRGHVVHAAFEGIGYNIAEILSFLGPGFASYKENVRAIGGGTKTPLWLQIVSDIAGITQTVPKVKTGASYGDALLAGLGIGLIKDEAHISSMIETDYVIRPDEKNHEQYMRYLDLFDRLYKTNRTLMSDILAVSHEK